MPRELIEPHEGDKRYVRRDKQGPVQGERRCRTVPLPRPQTQSQDRREKRRRRPWRSSPVRMSIKAAPFATGLDGCAKLTLIVLSTASAPERMPVIAERRGSPVRSATT